MCPFRFICDIYRKYKLLKVSNKKLSNTIKTCRLDIETYEDSIVNDYSEIRSLQNDLEDLRSQVDFLKAKNDILLFQHRNKDIFNSVHDKYNRKFRNVVKKMLFECLMDEKTKHDLIKSISDIEEDYFGDSEENADEIKKEFVSIKKELYQRDMRFKELWEKIDPSYFCALGTTPFYPMEVNNGTPSTR